MLYTVLKSVHVCTAIITASLFYLRVALDGAHVRWRHTPLRYIPHVNDTILLISAGGLVWVTGQYPFSQSWLTAKLFMLLGYIVAGKFALTVDYPAVVRVASLVVATMLLAGIFYNAIAKPAWGGFSHLTATRSGFRPVSRLVDSHQCQKGAMRASCSCWLT